MAALEDVLAANIERDVALLDLSGLVGVPGRTLRLCCEKVLGRNCTALPLLTIGPLCRDLQGGVRRNAVRYLAPPVTAR
jgi:hypothetical protein